MAELIEWCFEHVSYWTVAFFMALENSLVPFPSEAIVPPAGYKAAAGEMSFLLVVVFATLGADIGASINYAIARWLGRPFVYKFANSRIGKLCLVSEEKIRRAEAFFEKYGAAATLTGRLVPVVRQFIPFPAGLALLPPGFFIGGLVSPALLCPGVLPDLRSGGPLRFLFLLLRLLELGLFHLLRFLFRFVGYHCFSRSRFDDPLDFLLYYDAPFGYAILQVLYLPHKYFRRSQIRKGCQTGEKQLYLKAGRKRVSQIAIERQECLQRSFKLFP